MVFCSGVPAPCVDNQRIKYKRGSSHSVPSLRNGKVRLWRLSLLSSLTFGNASSLVHKLVTLRGAAPRDALPRSVESVPKLLLKEDEKTWVDFAPVQRGSIAVNASLVFGKHRRHEGGVC